jgi:hypothetical protein
MMNLADINQRDYGRLEADVEHLKATVDELRADVRIMRDLMEQGKGGWKLLIAVGGATSIITSFIGWLIHLWLQK